jgi:DNA-binding NtrC family response regulator
MGYRHGIIVVAEKPDVRNMLASWFHAAGYEVAVAATFPEAKDLLSLGPDLMVSELKLGEYNGLHLASRALNAGIPAIVIGPGDIAIERDAGQLGALYLSSVRRQDLLDVVAHELHANQIDHVASDSIPFVPSRRPMLEFPLPGRSNVSN